MTMTNSTSERLKQIRENRRNFYGGMGELTSDFDFLLSLLDSEAASDEPNLTEHDKTRFLERGFTVVENAGRNLRLIKRDDARQAITIKWDDLPALRELITLALDDGPMVIGLDMSGQAAKNAATSMRDLCVEKVKTEIPTSWLDSVLTGPQAVIGKPPYNCVDIERLLRAISTQVTTALQSVTLEQEQK